MIIERKKTPYVQPLAEINTTPLVDVMLVLLVIFIITAPLLPQALKVQLPQQNTEQQRHESRTITLQLDSNGNIVVNDLAIAPNDLASHLTALAAGQAATTELRLCVDKATRYEYLANVMAHAHAAGLVKIAFITQPE